MSAEARITRHRPGTPRPRFGPRVLVGFSGRTDIAWLRVLRPGFRHCFAVIECEGLWLLYDPAAHQTRLQPLGAVAMGTVLQWLQADEVTVVCRRTVDAPPRLAPIRPYTCVEAVKRLLGIQAQWVITPRQLFRQLTAPERINTKNMKKT